MLAVLLVLLLALILGGLGFTLHVLWWPHPVVDRLGRTRDLGRRLGVWGSRIRKPPALVWPMVGLLGENIVVTSLERKTRLWV